MSKKIEDLLQEKIKVLKLIPFVQVFLSTPLEETVRLMQESRNGYIIINDGKKAVGVFSEKDLVLGVLEKGVDLKEPVSKYMKVPVRSLTLNDSIGRAIELMYDYECRHIPLVNEKEEVISVLSVRAIVSFLAEHFPTETLNLPPKPGQISEAREGG